MTHHLRHLLAVLLCALALPAFSTDIQWHTTLSAACAAAARSGRPIFFNCYARWAGPSVTMDSIVLHEPLIADWLPQHFTPLRMDMQTAEGKMLAERYGIDGYAYYLVLDAEGNVVHRISGGARAPEFKQKLTAALDPATSLRGTRLKVESGQATAADTAAYLRALREARDGDTFRTVGTDFARSRQPMDYLDPAYWPFAVLAMTYHSDHFRALIDNRDAFVEAHGAESVNNLMESVLTRELRPWAEGKMQFLAARTDLDALLRDVEASQLPDTAATLLVGGMALLRTERKYAELLELMDRKGHLLNRYPGVRSGLELTFGFPGMTAADTTALVGYLDRAVEREKAAAGGRMSRTAQQLADFAEPFRTPAASVSGSGPRQPEGVAFIDGTFDAALQRAAAEDRLVFLDCQTVWCGPCRAMAKNVFSLPRVGQYFADRFVALKMDMETGEGPDLSHRFKVKAYPTMLVLTPDGRELHRIVGYRDATALIDELDKALAAQGK